MTEKEFYQNAMIAAMQGLLSAIGNGYAAEYVQPHSTVASMADEYAKNESYTMLPADNKTGGCAASLNTGAVLLLDITKFPLYDYFVFMGDDHLPRTKNWDKAFIQYTTIIHDPRQMSSPR